MKQAGWSIVALLWLAYFINYVDRQAVFSIFPVLEKELGFSGAQLGLIGSVFLWVYSLCSPVAGRVADRMRLELLIPASLVLWSLATLATGLSRSVESLLFWRGMMGVTEGLYFPAAVSAIGVAHAGSTRSRAIALHGTAQFAGSVAGGWFGGWIGDAGLWRWGFAGLSIVGIVYAPLLRLGLRGLPGAESAERSQAGLRPVFASRCYWALGLAFFVLCAMLWILYAWLPSFVHERYRLSLSASGLIATAWLQASSAAGILAGGALGDWVSKRAAAGRFYMVAGGLLLCSPLAWAIVAAHSLFVLKMAAVGFGLTAGVMMANVVASAYDVVSRAHYGLAAGALTLMGGLSGGLATVSIGRWKDSVGFEPLMAWAAVAGAGAAIVLGAVVSARFGRERV